MKKIFLVSIITFGFAALSFSGDAKADGQWISLFNGKDLTGWRQVNDGTFTATNGVLHLEGGKGWLRTRKEYTNFILEGEWRGLVTNYNSGFFLRAPLDGKPWATNVWQVNTKQSAIGELLAGSKKVVPSVTPPIPVNEWVKFRMEAQGRKLTLFVNGQHVWDFNEFDVDHGYIGLQAEGKAFDFRSLRVRELEASSPVGQK